MIFFFYRSFFTRWAIYIGPTKGNFGSFLKRIQKECLGTYLSYKHYHLAAAGWCTVNGLVPRALFIGFIDDVLSDLDHAALSAHQHCVTKHGFIQLGEA